MVAVFVGKAVKVVGLAKDHQVVEGGAAELIANAGAAVDFVGDVDGRSGVVREVVPVGEECVAAEGAVAEVVGVPADGSGATEKKAVTGVGARELALQEEAVVRLQHEVVDLPGWIVSDGMTVLHLVVAGAAIVGVVVEAVAVIVVAFAGVVVGYLKMIANGEFEPIAGSEEDVQ